MVGVAAKLSLDEATMLTRSPSFAWVGVITSVNDGAVKSSVTRPAASVAISPTSSPW